MSNVLTDLMREKQEWIESQKTRRSNSWLVGAFVVIIGIVVFELIQNPIIISSLIKLF